MTILNRKPRLAEIADRVIDMYVNAGVDLRTVTLEEFKSHFGAIVRRTSRRSMNTASQRPLPQSKV